MFPLVTGGLRITAVSGLSWRMGPGSPEEAPALLVASLLTPGALLGPAFNWLEPIQERAASTGTGSKLFTLNSNFVTDDDSFYLLCFL